MKIKLNPEEQVVICIVGLPGAGKTTLAKHIVSEHPWLKPYDDISKEEREQFFKDLEQGTPERPRDGISVVLTDPFLCKNSSRLAAERSIKRAVPDIKVIWIYFKNQPNRCYLNSLVRNLQLKESGEANKNVANSIKAWSKEYTIPDDAEYVLDCFDAYEFI